MASMGDMPSIVPDDERPETPFKAKPNAGRWKPGQSGNPHGVRPGSKHKATILAETLLDGETERITRKCVEMALEGEPVAMRLCMERVLSPKKSRPLCFALPVLNTANDAQLALAALVEGVASGAVLADEAATVSGIISAFLKSCELCDLEARLAALEQASAGQQLGAQYNA
jgi:Family of unknown function (DUF5681)